MAARLLYVTTSSRQDAERIARALLEDRSIACANILERMQSLYWWEGKVQTATEAVLLLKTAADRVEQVIERVRELHSYEVPCVLSVAVEAGNPEFLSWIEVETRSTSV